MTVKKEALKEVTLAPTAPEVTSYPFAFSDGDYAYNENDNYNFKMSSSSILIPLSDNVSSGITSLKTFLTENSGKVVSVTGYYKGKEDNTSAFPNLGLARANAVKNHLVENGIFSSQINTTGKLMDDMVVSKDNVFLGPIAYGLADKTENEDDELQALYVKITADPLVLHFNTGEAAINLSAEQRQKVADISKYLDKVKGATTQVTGHTDSEGNRVNNIRLGQVRADFAANYLTQNGITEAKVKTASKGPDTPVATNATEEGRSKNRRTVVTLKNN